MPLLPGWPDRLADRGRDPEPTAFAVPRSPRHYAGRTTYVSDREAAEAMAELASQRPLAWVGFDTEFKFDGPGVVLARGQIAHDPRSVHPLLLSLAMAEPDERGAWSPYNFVVDLRVRAVLPSVRSVLRLPLPFVGHFAHAELLCLLQLGLPEPDQLWDTWVCEKALYLGRGHKRYKRRPGDGEGDHARAGEEAELAEGFSYSLASTCLRYGVSYPFAGDKVRLQQGFLSHPDDAPFGREQIDYAAADAVAAAALYQPQVMATTQAGILNHLIAVEMPWTVTNARMVWNGVRVDRGKCRTAIDACHHHRAEIEPQLAAHGVTNYHSHLQLKEFFGRAGLLHLFRSGGRMSFDKDRLAEFQGRHPAIPLILAARRVDDLQREKILTGELEGCDGRVHPEYRQQGAHTGRQTCRWPNVLGLGRVFRPLIVPEPGYGIGEVDWSQIEVGIAAAVYHDEELVAKFNTGDVYSAMAQDFYGADLPDADRRMTGGEFKKKYRALRDRMKTCTLGIIYGLTPHGLANYLGTGKAEATALQERFMAMFPALHRALNETARNGGLRGHAATVTGLRRYRESKLSPLATWERNWLTNHPVQGSAAVVFKVAGNRLDRLYRPCGAKLIIPMHDAFVFEAPLGAYAEVAALTEAVMCQAVREYFPELRPQVEVNTVDPTCWNKDGRSDSIDRWVQDPLFRF